MRSSPMPGTRSVPGADQSRKKCTKAAKGSSYTPKPQGLLTAEAVLEANGIQDLADQIPDIAEAAVGNDLKFNVRVEFGGETTPHPETVEKINTFLSEVSNELKLRSKP